MTVKRCPLRQYVLTVNLSNFYLERRLADLLIFEQGKWEALEFALPIEDGMIKPYKISVPEDKEKWEQWCKHMTMEEQEIFLKDATMSVSIQAVSHFLFYYRPLPLHAQITIRRWIEDMEKKHTEDEIARKLNLNVAGLKKFKKDSSLFGVWLAGEFCQNADQSRDYGSLIEHYEELPDLKCPAASIVNKVYEITLARIQAMDQPKIMDYLSVYLKTARQVVESYTNKMGYILKTNDQLINILIREHGFIEDIEAVPVPGRDGGIPGSRSTRHINARVSRRVYALF